MSCNLILWREWYSFYEETTSNKFYKNKNLEKKWKLLIGALVSEKRYMREETNKGLQIASMTVWKRTNN